MADQCVSDCHRLAEKIRTSDKRVDVGVLQSFDELSDTLCSVLDVAELCRNVHPDPEFVACASNAFLQVSNVTKNLNADYALYEPLRRLLENHERISGCTSDAELSQEDVVMVKSLTSDFERGGIHLNMGDKSRLLRLQGEVDTLSAQFLAPSTSQASVLLLSSNVVNRTPHHFKRLLRRSPQKPNHYEVPMTSTNANMLLKWVSDSRIREKVFRMAHSVGQSERTSILDEILNVRKHIANILGQKSYADLLFEDRIASAPEDVLKFLENLSKGLQGRAQEEKNSLEIEKMKKEEYLCDESRVSVHGWDKSYYIGRLKARDYALSALEVSQYLPLSACIDGLAGILHQVFGLTLIRTLPNDGELWHTDVEKYKLVDVRGSLVGEIFMDLHPREGKYEHAAHFAIRCGRQPADRSEYQTPVVALVCNFGLGKTGHATLLTISEYETLFHEFGHSLHSLLSRTKYQHLSGTRVQTDFVEVPSHLFEHFAWDPRVISRIARHHKTGDPMPTRQINALVASRRGFASTELQTQILFSAMDLTFHGPDPPIGFTTEAFESLQDRLTVYQPDRGVPLPTSFHHFIGYGAGYYAYIFARIISTQLWSRLFENDPFSRAGGFVVQNEMLAFGGARDPAHMMHSILQGRVTCDSFLRTMGISDLNGKETLYLPLSDPSK